MNVTGRNTEHGIDVSRWQNAIDWKAAAADPDWSIRFAILKATGGDGALYVDPQFRANAKGCTVPWGAYHFASRMAHDADTEARYFCDTIRGTGWTLPPVLDWEPYPSVDQDAAYRWVLAFCEEVERGLGVRPVIYTGAYVSLRRGPGLLAYDLWLAAYTNQPIPCAPWATWTIWQFTSEAHLDGIVGNTVDMNIAEDTWLSRQVTGGIELPPTPPAKDWFDMATTQELRQVVAEELDKQRGQPVVQLNDVLWRVIVDPTGIVSRAWISGTSELQMLREIGQVSDGDMINVSQEAEASFQALPVVGPPPPHL